jgi:hypothetical protein
MRAGWDSEKVGVPSASLVCEGFVGQGSSTAAGLGMPNIPIAMIPGHVDTQTKEQLAENIKKVTLDMVVKSLTVQPEIAKGATEPASKDVVFKGTFEEVNKFFYENKYGDGLPIVPPTVEKVQEFLKFTNRSPDEVLGVLLPDQREATVWNVAVNGVMSGCRPEYMPVLIAIVEAMADPKYGIEHSGNTPGSEELVIINGPIIKDLDFNYKQGVLRVGYQANTSIGRFVRVYLRNVAGFLPGTTDKGCYGNTWRVVLAENEDVLAKIGWNSMGVSQGFKKDDNVVTIARMMGGDLIISVEGATAEKLLSPRIVNRLTTLIEWQVMFTANMDKGWACSETPLLLLTPVLAETIAKSGWSKEDVQKYLFEKARVSATSNPWMGRVDLCKAVSEGTLPKVFCESTDPKRMVPVVCSPKDILVGVTGDPLRTNAYLFTQNGFMGYVTSRAIKLPANWDKLLDEARAK